MTASESMVLLAGTAAVLLSTLIVFVVQFVRGRRGHDDRGGTP